jgi:hypothetical protein
VTLSGLVVMALAAGLAVVAGGAGALVLDVRGRAAQALAALVLAAASIVAPALALSLVDALTQWAWLAGQLVIAGALAGAAVRLGRTLPSVRLADLGPAARAHPAVAVLVAAVTAGMAFQFAGAILIAPQNWDAMAYHLSKAAYWLQFDSATQFPDGTWRQLYTPPNAELLQAWTMEMLGTDRFVQLVQWVAGVACGLAVSAGAREVGARRAHAVFAGALFLALPQALLQSATAQNDLVAAAFVTSSALFFVRGLRRGHAGELVAGGVAAGLAVGTKGTALVVAPGIAVLVLGVVLRVRPPARTIAVALAALVAGVAVLGAFNWALSLKNTGELAPSVADDATFSPAGGSGGRSAADAVVGNAGNLLWQFADLPGMRVTVLDRLVATPVRTTFGDRYADAAIPLEIDDAVNEDRSGFGAVGFFLLFPVLLLAAVGRRTDPRRRLLAAAGLVALGVYLLFVGANPFAMRVMLPWVALVAPLLAILATHAWTRALAIGLALVSLVPVVLIQDFRPVVPSEGRSTLALSRWDQFQLSRWPFGTAVTRLTNELGRTAPIGYVGTAGSWDYPFFGPRLERRVIRLPEEDATPERLARERLAGILFVDVGEPPPVFRRTLLAEKVWLARPR